MQKVSELPKLIETAQAKELPLLSESEAKAYIYKHESGNRTDAVNKSSGACSLGQALPCSKLSSICPNWQTDYECDDKFFTSYMQNRYGTWQKAVEHFKLNNWW